MYILHSPVSISLRYTYIKLNYNLIAIISPYHNQVKIVVKNCIKFSISHSPQITQHDNFIKSYYILQDMIYLYFLYFSFSSLSYIMLTINSHISSHFHTISFPYHFIIISYLIPSHHHIPISHIISSFHMAHIYIVSESEYFLRVYFNILNIVIINA